MQKNLGIPPTCKLQTLFATGDTVHVRNTTHFTAVAQVLEGN